MAFLLLSHATDRNFLATAFLTRLGNTLERLEQNAQRQKKRKKRVHDLANIHYLRNSSKKRLCRKTSNFQHLHDRDKTAKTRLENPCSLGGKIARNLTYYLSFTITLQLGYISLGVGSKT